MRAIPVTAAAIALLGVHAAPVLAGGGSRVPSHGAPAQQSQVHERMHSGHSARQPAPEDARTARNGVHPQYGGPRLEQRSDPNQQNLYRPMFSLDATNPGEPHPYFQTRKDGFGYPASRPGATYLGNGIYAIPR